VIEWLGRHPRWTFHSRPARQLAQRRRGFFAILTKRRLKRGVFKASSISRAAIIARRRPQPAAKAFVCTADPDKSSPPQSWASSVGSIH